jgi:hydrogenase expression/formation protein HypE
MINQDFIKLEHGSGGVLSRQLVEEIIFPYFQGESYTDLNDSASLSVSGNIGVTTDTFVVDPLFFPGSDIGKLAVFGTCNDLSVGGAQPKYLTCGFVIEEGLPLSELRRVLESMRTAALEAGVSVVSGDTKVVPQGKGGGLFINTAGIGEKIFTGELTPGNVKPGDAVILSGPVGAHGLAVLSAREKLKVGEKIESDCANLFPLCSTLFNLGPKLRFMRDATRGGVSSILNELCGAGRGESRFGVDVDQGVIPVQKDVHVVAEILGLNPLEIANEGVFIAVAAEGSAEAAIDILRKQPLGRRSSIIGRVTGDHPGKVYLKTEIGGTRILDFPRGMLLPRIC